MKSHIVIIDYYKNTPTWGLERVIFEVTLFQWKENGVKLKGHDFDMFIPYSENIASITVTPEEEDDDVGTLPDEEDK